MRHAAERRLRWQLQQVGFLCLNSCPSTPRFWSRASLGIKDMLHGGGNVLQAEFVAQTHGLL